MCRKLKPTSKIVFVDIGAALDFVHKEQPAVYLTHLYQTFGFRFDHIYAYEMTQTDPELVYELIPDNLKAAYHWYNVGVVSDPQNSKNPFQLLKENFHPDDCIIVKLDIDKGDIELPLAHQLLNDDELVKLVDCFYFEHHVFLDELATDWGDGMSGSIDETLKLFSGLREKGIAAHFWV
jgi:hypothetical protein